MTRNKGYINTSINKKYSYCYSIEIKDRFEFQKSAE